MIQLSDHMKLKKKKDQSVDAQSFLEEGTKYTVMCTWEMGDLVVATRKFQMPEKQENPRTQ